MKDTITPPEHAELDAWVTESDENMKLFEDLTDDKTARVNREYFKNDIAKKPLSLTAIPWIATAAILVIVGFFIYRYAGTAKEKDVLPDKEDGFPGSNSAILTLPDGRIFELLKLPDGDIEKGITKVRDGELLYTDAITSNTQGLHLLTIPVGSQYLLILEDGTKVWLNAVTKISYPATFTDSIRQVEVDGEAYFEVAEGDNRPFMVKLKDLAMVNVSGTRFNVNDYSNEPVCKVTLLQGKLDVTSFGKSQQMNTGEQLEITQNNLNKISNADTAEATSWLRGEFLFNNESLFAVMRQVERWYGVKAIVEITNDRPIYLGTKKRQSMKKFLPVLEKTASVKIRQEDGILHVFAN